MITKKDEQEIKEAVDEAESNISEEHSLSTVEVPQALAAPQAFKGVDIQGLESVPAYMVAVPFCRLIQPTSKKTEMADGKEAPQGSFLFNDTQESVSELDFVLLRAKHEYKRVNKDGQFVDSSYIGETKQKPQVSILGITRDTDKLFILSLSSTSFSGFGKLIAKFKSLQIDKTWRIALKATSKKTENDKGKYYIVNFTMGKELTENEMQAMEKTASEYGVVLDREIIPED